MPRNARSRLEILSFALVAASHLATPVAADSGCVSSTDAEIYSLIDTLKPIAEAITIDGDDSDWSSIPTFPDALNDYPSSSAYDIVDSAIAVLDDRILYMAHTSGPINTSAYGFTALIEVANTLYADAQIILGSAVNPVGLPHQVILFDSENQPTGIAGTITSASLEIAYGSNFIEVSIPFSLVQPFVDLTGSRSWGRGGLASFNLGTQDLRDQGPGVSMYRLGTTPFDLDPPLQVQTNTPHELELPLVGRWLVSQGAFGGFSHGDYWAYDLSRVDISFNPSSPRDSTDNDDYYAFGGSIISPADGTVSTVIDSNPDVTPLDPMFSDPFNIVALDVGGGITVSMLHQKQDSAVVTPSQVVTTGEFLAQVGNSGYSTSAHLHLEINESGGSLGTSIRGVDLQNVEVSLNPVNDDPWARTCSSWEPREGFFVESLSLSHLVPSFGPVGLGVMALMLAAAAWPVLRRSATRSS